MWMCILDGSSRIPAVPTEPDIFIGIRAARKRRRRFLYLMVWEFLIVESGFCILNFRSQIWHLEFWIHQALGFGILDWGFGILDLRV